MLLCFSSKVFSQFSFYGNTSYGYYQNPLYNYEKKGDQLRQSYLEMNYLKGFSSSNLKLSYVSGLMLFNQFSDRNFYEHNLFAKYDIRLTPKETAQQSVKKTGAEPAADEESEEASTAADKQSDETAAAEDEESSESLMKDSTASYLTFVIRTGARHDKDAFKEFNNFGTGFTLSYKAAPGDLYSLRITNSADLRSYAYLSELSNITDLLSVQISNRFKGSYQYGFSLTGGIKYYTQSVYDTTKFETKRSFNQKSQGKGKLGSKITVPSGKQILIEPQANGTTQIIAGLFFNKIWEGATVLKTNVLYRYNPQTQTRYLAQYANTSMLSEDIYNDYFSYQGLEAKASVDQSLPFGLQLSMEYNIQQKNFEAPALNLDGVQIGQEKRTDLTNSLEVYLSRNFTLFEGFDLNLMLGTGVLRNQSNDNYNDFSSFHLTGTIGIGF